MKTKLVCALAMMVSAHAWPADPPKAQPASLTTPAPTDDQVVAQFRNDLMAKRADIMAKGLTLTAEQAAKFWPMFETFQKEQDAIVNEQITATQHYSEHYQTLSEADSLEYVNALLVRDKKMNDLRTKWLAKFQSIIPSGMAARAIQLDRRLGQVAQVQLSARIPLVH
jgi:Spy/CpxP family protein refolding chaperone